MDNRLCDLVFVDLVHHHLWTETELVKLGDFSIVCGRPSQQLSNDDEAHSDSKEFVYPILMSQYASSRFSMSHLDHIFSHLPQDAKRLTLGIVNDDGTIVYYFIYKGLRKPKKN